MKEKLWSTVRRISLRQLRVLSAAHRAGTLAGAADALAVSGPAMALQLRELEPTIGVPLLERGTSGFRATLAGEAVLASATRIEQELVHCLETVASLSDPEAGRVSLGIISTARWWNWMSRASPSCETDSSFAARTKSCSPHRPPCGITSARQRSRSPRQGERRVSAAFTPDTSSDAPR
jgi:hypothetical protein